MRVLIATLALASAGCCPTVRGPRRPATRAPRALVAPGFLAQYAATHRFRLGHPRAIAVAPDGSAVYFLRARARSFVHDLWVHDVARRRERPLVTARGLLAGGRERLSAAERARRERQRVTARGIAAFRLCRDGSRLLVPLGGRLFLVDPRTGRARELPRPSGGPPIDPRLSPDCRQVAFVSGGDLYVQALAGGPPRRLTRRDRPTLSYGLAEFVAQEEMGRHRGFWWLADSARLLVQETDTSGVETAYIADPLHPTRAPQSWRYPRAGRRNARVRLALISAAARPASPRWVRWDRARYPYLAAVAVPRRGPVSLVVQDRRQRELLLLALSPATGATRELLRERDPAWVNIDPQVPRWLDDGSGFLWTTERRGAWQLELRRADGRLRRALTAPWPGYRRLLDVDQRRGDLFVVAAPTQPEEQIYRLSLTGGPPRRVSRERGLHDAVFARGHGVYVQRVAPLSGARRQLVRRRDGRVLGALKSVAERPPFAPRLELTAVESGGRRFHAALVRPRRFRAGRRYPVLLYVYAGPGHRVVRATGARYLLQQWIADQGFVVVSLDGRGTPGRGRAWERAIRGDLITIPLADQVAGLRALAARRRELDLERVGVFGWSFGGTMAAMALLERPGLFRAAVAVAPVTDWRDYDTHYTERYLGLPAENRRGYRKSSVLPHAGKLRRPLLIVHGTADDNVYFGHSLKLSNALFRAGRPHRLLPLAGRTHIVPDPLVTRRLYQRVVTFFRRHLGQERAR